LALYERWSITKRLKLVQPGEAHAMIAPGSFQCPAGAKHGTSEPEIRGRAASTSVGLVCEKVVWLPIARRRPARGSAVSLAGT